MFYFNSIIFLILLKTIFYLVRYRPKYDFKVADTFQVSEI
jgi:hypothetical protein